MVYFCNIFFLLHTLLKWWWWCLFINTNDDLDFSLDGFGCLPAFTKSFQKIQLESKWNMAFWVVTAENFQEQPTTWNGSPVFPDWIFQMEIRVPFLQNYLRYQFLVSQLCFGKWNWFIKGLVNRLSHDFHFDINCNVLTHWVGLSVSLWLLVIGVSWTLLVVGGFRSKELWVLLEEETDPSVVRCCNGGTNSPSQ